MSYLLRIAYHIQAAHPRTAARGPQDGREHTDGRGLARAVRPKQRDDLAFAHVQIEIGNCREIAKALAEALGLNQKRRVRAH